MPKMLADAPGFRRQMVECFGRDVIRLTWP